MRLSALTLTVFAAVLVAAAPPSRSAAPALPPLAQRSVPTQLPKNARPLHYRLSIRPDAAHLAFAGSARINIEILEPSEKITLNAADLAISSARLTDAAGATRQASAVSLEPGAQTATLAFGGRIAPGRYFLTIDYTGKIYLQAAGFFALDYDSPAGRKRALFTQFEASDARRFLPCWDEPRFRTPFDLDVAIPAGEQAIGNMPAARTEARPDGSRVVTFATTPPMSSYLLFLGIGDFDRITRRAGATEIGVVTRRGNGEQGRWALESAARILPLYNEYFGTPFPLPKLDNVAGPGSSQFFGAMENWGAIFSFENALLLDPAISGEGSRENIFGTAAHEMAHQWFGDLVTMAWWDDIWLNEGFASWMATKATKALHPEWQPELDLVDGREGAMRLDSVATTHPVVQHIQTVDQMSQAFDSITYQKGEAVITMLEDYVGSDAWRRGVQAYIRAHRLSNTQSDDLWSAVEAAAGKPVTAIAHDFTLQPGIPIIRVESAACRSGRTLLVLRQTEFSRDRPGKAPLAWRVPVTAAGLSGPPVKSLVQGGGGTIEVSGCGPVVVNSGQTGYYRTLYAPTMLAGLAAAFPRLQPIDQIGLLADWWGLGLAGYQPASAALDLVQTIATDANPRLVARAAAILGQLYGLYRGDERRQSMVAREASARLGPWLARIGWAPRPNEPAPVAILRTELIRTLGTMGDRQVVAEANRLYDSNDAAATRGPLRTTILAVVAVNIDAARWERLHATARAERNPLVRGQLYRLLANARDAALARRALDLALTAEPGATGGSAMIAAVSGQHPDLAFDFAIANRERVEALVDASSRSRFIPGLGGGASDPAMIAKLEDYATRYMNAQSRRPADIAIGAIRDRVKVRRERLPDIARWLDTHSA